MITVIHKRCGMPAFYFKNKLYSGDLIMASNVILLDGSHPVEHSPMICGSCGKTIRIINIDTIIQKEDHWTDWFLLEEDKWKRNKLL